MNHIDSKFIGLISSRLEKFKRIKSNLYNFRCPVCGDSKKNKSKTRGYLYAMKADVNFKCHNCGASMTFSNFLKYLDTVIHKQYVFERFKTNSSGRGTVVEKPTFNFEAPKFKTSIKLPRASEHPRPSGYLTARKLDPKNFYYAQHFKEFVNSLKPTFDSTKYDEERIVIPLVRDSKLIGVQGRALSTNPVKYLTIMLDEDAPKIYGLDTVDKGATVYITEGPFDSTFLRNSVAMCGADLVQRDWGISDCCWVFDNEPRNREITRRISNTIDRGEKVVIWPSNIIEKDINDMVLAGHHVQNLVQSNTYSGLQAKLNFNTWKKI